MLSKELENRGVSDRNESSRVWLGRTILAYFVLSGQVTHASPNGDPDGGD
jgi:hypothetical protein